MQRVDTSRWLRTWRREDNRLLLSLIVLSLSLTAAWLIPGNAAEPSAAAAPADTGAVPAREQERFLQHFISRSLGQPATTAREAAPTAPPPVPGQPQAITGATAAVAAVSPPVVGSASMSSTVTTIVLSLGAMLGCLLLVAYLMRRYVFFQAPFGKRATPLRVVARTHLTPKALVALLEVPGKTLVIGVTGNTMVTLAEAVMDLEENDVATVSGSRPSFAATLDENTQEPCEPEPEEETLLHVSERIQRKVSGLKQL